LRLDAPPRDDDDVSIDEEDASDAKRRRARMD
jgi:hypothetical protein